MTWSNEKVLQLIAEYEAKPVLWNPKDRNYKDKIKKVSAWGEIANTLNVTRLEVEHKLRILLVQYRREKSKIIKMVAAGHDLDELETTAWYAYRSFNFLKLRPKNGHVSDEIDIDNSINFNNTQYEQIKTEPTSDECDAVPNVNCIEDFLESTMEEIPSTKKKKRQKTSAGLTIAPRANTLGDIDLFASYIASEMKALRHPQIRSKLKRNILKALLVACEEDDTTQVS